MTTVNAIKQELYTQQLYIQTDEENKFTLILPYGQIVCSTRES